MFFFFSSRRRHTRFDCDWSSDVCSSDLFDVYLDTTDTLRVFTQGYEQNSFDYLFGVDVAKPCYRVAVDAVNAFLTTPNRSEERRVGKECRSRWSPYH